MNVPIYADAARLFSETNNMQLPGEFYPALEFLLTQRLTNVLEIGAGQGYSMWGWMHVCDGIGVSVDLPNGPYAGRSEAVCDQREAIWRSCFGDRITSIRGDSQQSDAVERVRQVLNGRLVDFLFIDGDHRYPAVKNDYLNYRQFVSPTGIIGFHDINDTPHHRSFGVTVCDLWNELSGTKVEFNTHQHWAGIGFLLLGPRS